MQDELHQIVGILTTAHHEDSRAIKRGRQNSTGVEQSRIAVAECIGAVPYSKIRFTLELLSVSIAQRPIFT
jgi:hypothetical protein